MIHLLLMAAGPAGDGAQQNPIIGFLPIVLILVVFYFFLIRPQQKKQKELQEMINNLQRGDKVVTNGGIMGQIIGTRDDIVVIKSGESKFEVSKNFIAEKINQEVKTG